MTRLLVCCILAAVPAAGPMAQDFHRAFGLGEDDRHTNAMDLAGGNMETLRAENRNLGSRLDRLEKMLDRE